MKPGALWKVSVVTTEAAEEAIAEVLSAALGEPATSYTDLKSGKTTVTVYLSKKLALSKALEQELRTTLKELRKGEGQLGIVRPTIARIKHENWANSWKHHFKPLEIAGRLLIRPSWSVRRTKAGQAEIILDPGMSFGTGQHPTTAFCLKELVRLRDQKLAQSFLDVGTGSGILAICAAKLGYEPVHALDVDPVSIKVAKVNAKKNGVGRKVQFTCRDFTQGEPRGAQQYTVVCANLIANLLLSEKDRLVARVQKGGQLVVAGILKEEFEQIRKAFGRIGMRLERSRKEKEWCSGSFLWRERPAGCKLRIAK